jgi:hypothetical protein
MSSLSPLWAPRLRITSPTVTEKVRTERSIGLMDPAPSVPAEKAQSRVDRLTVDDVREASTAAINMVIPHNPQVIAQAIIDAGRRRRNELPTPVASLRPAARAILLSGELRRGRQLSEEEAAFMADFLAEIGAT